MAKIAMCRRCAVPLVCTMAFSKFEFYCLDCGDKLGWMSPDGADETPELLADMHAREAEWKESAGGKLLIVGAWHKDCDQCRLGDNGATHIQHATDEEIAADAVAREWIRGRLVGVIA